MVGLLGSTRLRAAARRCGALLVVAALGLGPMVIGDPAGAVETRLNPDADARVALANPNTSNGTVKRRYASVKGARSATSRDEEP